MTVTPQNFFDAPEAGRGGVPRDRRGRALLVPRGMNGKNIRVPYSSASGLAEHIADSEHFHEWEMCYLAIAMGRNPDLAALAAVEPYHTGLDPLPAKVKRESKYRLKQIIERALDRQKIHEKADFGTAVHAATEPGVQYIPESVGLHAASFEESLRLNCIRIVETEQFTVNDGVMTAGTYDHGVRVLGHPLLHGYVIADKKTGRIDPFHWEIQIATYARGEVYSVENEFRQHISSDVNLDYGLVFHIDAVTGVTTLHVIDLQRGWTNAIIAASARDTQDEGAKVIEYKPAGFDARLASVTTRDEAAALWKSTDDAEQRARVEERARHLS